MIEARILSAQGIEHFKNWLQSSAIGEPPTDLVHSDEYSSTFEGVELDEQAVFSSRFEFGKYLTKQFENSEFSLLLSPSFDGLWCWIAVLYFKQLTAKRVARAEHYIVTRKGSTGSLAYRHAARTSYELVKVHGEAARICLNGPMHTFGDMTEQLASRQTIARNVGFFQAAYSLYFDGQKLRRGAASKPKKPNERKPGDRTGLGSARRLAIALQRLDLTYDTEIMDSSSIRVVLPREFARWDKA